MKNFFLNVLCVLFPLIIFSQTNFKKGKIIKNDNVEVEFYINNQDWYYSPSKISYKLNADDANIIEEDVTRVKSF